MSWLIQLKDQLYSHLYMWYSQITKLQVKQTVEFIWTKMLGSHVDPQKYEPMKMFRDGYPQKFEPSRYNTLFKVLYILYISSITILQCID